VWQWTLAIGAGQGLSGRYGSGGLGRVCSVGFGFGDAAEGDLEAEGSELSRTRGSFTPGASALTAAELRLLPMLNNPPVVSAIAKQVSLSPNTVRSQAMSIYHKLGASSRDQAVTRSRELGLLEG